MLRNYTTVFIRNVKKQKIYSLITIVGLAIGVAVCLTIALFIRSEFGYDMYNAKADRTYRVCVKTVVKGASSCNSKSAGPLGPAMRRDFPEVETYTRLGYFGVRVFKVGDTSIRQYDVYYADSTFFDVFTVEFLEGNPKTALTQPNAIVLTESAARKYFGDGRALGNTLIADEHGPYTVTGVMKDFPANAHFRCPMLASICTYPVIDSNYWLELWYTTYIVLKPGTDERAFAAKLQKAVPRYVGAQAEAALGMPLTAFTTSGNAYDYVLQPLGDIYLYSTRTYGVDPNTEWGDVRTSDIAYVYIFGGVALFILAIAVINFVNLATARSERRAKEVGIRKTLGARRMSLVAQFMTESVLTSVCAVVLSLALLELFLPAFNTLAGRALTLRPLASPEAVAGLVLFTLVLGVLAGLYPALYLSSFSPMRAFNAHSGAMRTRKSLLRTILVVVQFSISIALIICTIVIREQLEYIQTKHLGFNKEQLLMIYQANALGGRIDAFKQEALKDPRITAVSTSLQMFSPGVPGHGFFFNRKTGTDPLSLQYLEADEKFLDTYQIPLAAGRFFSHEFSADTSCVIVNEAALREFGTRDVLGKELTILGTHGEPRTYRIIGVTKDFNWESLHQKVRPLAIFYLPERTSSNIITVRIKGDDLSGAIAHLKRTWTAFARGEGFHSTFVDRNLARMYEAEEKTADIAVAVSLLAIFIACLGLFGLASFVTEQRVKEIGIRKVMGASVTEIVMLLSAEFGRRVLYANMIAWPLAFYVMDAWLENFAYRVAINLWIFVAAGVIALAIALLTVSYQAVKAAFANPVLSLRYE